MIRWLVVLVVLASAFAVACATPSAPQMAVRGMTLNTDDTEYATSFTYRGSVVVTGDEATVRRAYIAVLSFRLISGGGDDIKKGFATTQYETIPVVGGTAEFSLGAGYRKKKSPIQEGDTWDPAKFDVEVVGVVPVESIGNGK